MEGDWKGRILVEGTLASGDPDDHVQFGNFIAPADFPQAARLFKGKRVNRNHIKDDPTRDVGVSKDLWVDPGDTHLHCSVELDTTPAGLLAAIDTAGGMLNAFSFDADIVREWHAGPLVGITRMRPTHLAICDDGSEDKAKIRRISILDENGRLFATRILASCNPGVDAPSRAQLHNPKKMSSSAGQESPGEGGAGEAGRTPTGQFVKGSDEAKRLGQLGGAARWQAGGGGDSVAVAEGQQGGVVVGETTTQASAAPVTTTGPVPVTEQSLQVAFDHVTRAHQEKEEWRARFDLVQKEKDDLLRQMQGSSTSTATPATPATTPAPQNQPQQQPQGDVAMADPGQDKKFELTPDQFKQYEEFMRRDAEAKEAEVKRQAQEQERKSKVRTDREKKLGDDLQKLLNDESLMRAMREQYPDTEDVLVRDETLFRKMALGEMTGQWDVDSYGAAMEIVDRGAKIHGQLQQQQPQKPQGAGGGDQISAKQAERMHAEVYAKGLEDAARNYARIMQQNQQNQFTGVPAPPVGQAAPPAAAPASMATGRGPSASGSSSQQMFGRGIEASKKPRADAGETGAYSKPRSLYAESLACGGVIPPRPSPSSYQQPSSREAPAAGQGWSVKKLFPATIQAGSNPGMDALSSSSYRTGSSGQGGQEAQGGHPFIDERGEWNLAEMQPGRDFEAYAREVYEAPVDARLRLDPHGDWPNLTRRLEAIGCPPAFATAGCWKGQPTNQALSKIMRDPRSKYSEAMSRARIRIQDTGPRGEIPVDVQGATQRTMEQFGRGQRTQRYLESLHDTRGSSRAR